LVVADLVRAWRAVVSAGRLRRFIGRPELAMLLLGSLAFAIDRLHPEPPAPQDPASALIVVPDGASAQLRRESFFGDGFDAAPADDTEAWIRGEVLYREALRLGLDNNDIVVRRRLVQKMEYLLDGMSVPQPVEHAALEAFYTEHAQRYAREPAQSFTQVFLNLDRGAEAAQREANAILTRLAGRSADAAAQHGDPLADGSRTWRLPESRIAQRFGDSFLAALGDAPMGRWSGPLASRLGLHLVFREEAVPAHLPPLDEQYGLVVRDFLDRARLAQRERHYAQIAARYTIRRPEPQLAAAGGG
jgi:hypothetical protein